MAVGGSVLGVLGCPGGARLSRSGGEVEAASVVGGMLACLGLEVVESVADPAGLFLVGAGLGVAVGDVLGALVEIVLPLS